MGSWSRDWGWIGAAQSIDLEFRFGLHVFQASTAGARGKMAGAGARAGRGDGGRAREGRWARSVLAASRRRGGRPREGDEREEAERGRGKSEGAG